MFIDLQKVLILLNMTSCWLTLNTTVFVTCQIIGLSPISSTGNNLFQLMVMYPIILQVGVHYFSSNFYFQPNDSPSKTMKNVFYFI